MENAVQIEPSPLTVFVLVNAQSGTGHDDAYRDRLIELFRADGVEAQVKLAGNRTAFKKYLTAAANGPEPIVVAGGGDGTVSGVVNAILGHNKTLGVLPLGTLNHFAKDLGIPLKLEDAVAAICRGQVQPVDVADVNGHVFVNNSSIGLYPQIVHHREAQQQLGRGKWAAFVWAMLAVMRRFSFVQVRLSANGKQFAGRTPLFFIGNNRYEMAGLHIGARQRLDEGRLSGYLTKRTTRWGLFLLALRALVGRLRTAGEFVSFATEEIFVETRRRRIDVAVDGEVMEFATPLHYRIRPGELRVMVPGEAAGTEGHR
jgi:YegS/Rv2252/BmrU family lipid kinase